MKYEEKVERLEEHLADHPKDYQAVVAHLKARSDLIEHKRWVRIIERKKRIAEYRRQRKEKHNGTES